MAQCLGPCHMYGKPAWSSWPWVSAWPITSCCGQRGKTPADERSLSPSLSEEISHFSWYRFKSSGAPSSPFPPLLFPPKLLEWHDNSLHSKKLDFPIPAQQAKGLPLDSLHWKRPSLTARQSQADHPRASTFLPPVFPIYTYHGTNKWLHWLEVSEKWQETLTSVPSLSFC